MIFPLETLHINARRTLSIRKGDCLTLRATIPIYAQEKNRHYLRNNGPAKVALSLRGLTGGKLKPYCELASGERIIIPDGGRLVVVELVAGSGTHASLIEDKL